MLEAGRANTAMRQLLAPLSWSDVPPLTDNDLLAKLAGGLAEINSCVVLKEELPPLSGAEGGPVEQRFMRHDLDRTSHECFVNHVHPKPHRAAQSSVLACLAYAACLARMLETCPFKGPFLIVISCGLETFETAVRFHRMRVEEGPWLDDNLERYEREAILAMTSSDLEQEMSQQRRRPLG